MSCHCMRHNPQESPNPWPDDQQSPDAPWEPFSGLELLKDQD